MPNIQLIRETNILKIIAVNKLETEKPRIKWFAINTINPLITNRKRPMVTIVTGNVSIIRMGRTMELSSASTTATTKAANGDETTTPGRIYPTTIMDIVLIIIRVNMILSFWIILLSLFKGITIY